MPSHTIDDAERYLSHVEAARATEDLFSGLYEEVDPVDSTVAGLRRRRRRASNSIENPIKTVSLVEQDGVLYWRDGIPVRPSGTRRRGRRRGAGSTESDSVVLTRECFALAPNKVVAAISAIDRHLNPSIGASLSSRLRSLRRSGTDRFELENATAVGPFPGRTLLFVHGTFSNADNLLSELVRPGGRGLRFVNRVTAGPQKYDRVLFFEQPTLAVSPIINAFELGRAFAGSTGQIDVIAHSRGGLVVRWWLEAFGSSLNAKLASSVRAILVGSPLNGTSLAAPDKIQHAMSLVSNIGTFAEKTLFLVGAANPFVWVATKLIEVIVSVAGVLTRTPLVDAVTALIPGLAGQSMTNNNYELNRLRAGPVAISPAYYAIVSNFETKDPGWKFWRNFRKNRIRDLAADFVFPGPNDLVVDTNSMTDFGVRTLKLAGPACDFSPSDTVWHCNYFRQDRTINYIAARLGIALD